MSLAQDRRGQAQVAAITRNVGAVMVVGTSLSALALGCVFWGAHMAQGRTGPGLSVAVEVPGGALAWAVAWWLFGALALIFGGICGGRRRLCQSGAAVGNLGAFVLCWVLGGASLAAVLDGSAASLVVVPLCFSLGVVHLGLGLLYGVSAILNTDIGRG